MAMNLQTVATLNLKILLNKIIIKGYGGGVVHAVGQTENLNIKIGEVVLELPFWIVENRHQRVPVIIGQPFTVKDSDNLNFFLNTEKEGLRKCTFGAKRNCIVQANYVGYVECVPNISGEVYVEGSVRLKEGEESVVPNCVMHVEDGNSCRIPVVNLVTSEVIIKENDVVARASSCIPDDDPQPRGKVGSEPFSLNDLHINANLSETQKECALELINKYRRVFAKNLGEMGCTEKAKMTITVTKDEIIKYMPYRMAATERDHVNRIITDLLNANIVQESESPFSSPILLVSKPNGKKRLCIDYRKLNAITQKDRHPIPLIDDQIDRLRNYEC